MNGQGHGIKFSQNYLHRGAPLQDSDRARRRIYRLFTSCRSSSVNYVALIEGGTGAKVPGAHHGGNWEGFFEKAELRDVLDAITLICRHSVYPKRWVEGCEQIFREENLSYRIDGLGGVHLHVDDEFERNWSATLLCLGLPRYGEVRKQYQAAQHALDSQPMRGAEALRSIFSAAETAFRLMLREKVSRLGAAEIKREFSAFIQNRYDGRARDAVNRQLVAFAEWVNAALSTAEQKSAIRRRKTRPSCYMPGGVA